jgi:hypothetical protein
MAVREGRGSGKKIQGFGNAKPISASKQVGGSGRPEQAKIGSAEQYSSRDSTQGRA